MRLWIFNHLLGQIPGEEGGDFSNALRDPPQTFINLYWGSKIEGMVQRQAKDRTRLQGA